MFHGRAHPHVCPDSHCPCPDPPKAGITPSTVPLAKADPWSCGLSYHDVFLHCQLPLIRCQELIQSGRTG